MGSLEANYLKLTQKNLIQLCKKRSLKYAGLKKDLISRLVQHDEEGKLPAPSSPPPLSSLPLLGTSRRRCTKTVLANGNEQGNGNSHKEAPIISSTANKPMVITPPRVDKQAERENRQNIVFHKRPIQTIYYFLRELPFTACSIMQYILRFQKTILLLLLVTTLLLCAEHLDGSHKQMWTGWKENIFWWSWWILLGFLSSCGFGTGLHTFVLYLGPFIAKVTMAAYECGTTDFPSPPYPHDIVCPNVTVPNAATAASAASAAAEVNLFTVMLKVQLEAVLWGVGTAIGELPPYFVARAARLSGDYDEDDEELQEFEDLLRTKSSQQQQNGSASKNNGRNNNKKLTKRHHHHHAAAPLAAPAALSWTKQMELAVTDLIMRAGFLGIVACASIPNPLFDLAGMTCGHFNVPFWSFFGATVIGKAFIKMHIQQLFVIALFTQSHVDTILHWMEQLPWYGHQLREPFMLYLDEQKKKLHSAIVIESNSWVQFLSWGFAWLLISYFLYSIVNTMAQSYDRRLCQWKRAANVANTNGKVD